MRTRLPGLAAALLLAALAVAGPAAQAAAPAAVPAVDGPTCVAHDGSVEYDSVSGLWICVGGRYDGESIN
ncbi:hypothetical protein EF910_32740 [Streptomyces sp. WAC07149]|uniref:hypothetical protein n=1 Tax=Streptomyces sp. WAC07149 TaxID=2487425 RepID=UPI000F77E253|nr:hypothetical protein [Streptomyces sp. WAC07149]RST00196.1 hypothetical protein EF910_32740 [Streptomyces sp. WAC07149]